MVFDLAQLCPDLGLGDGAVRGELDEVVLTGVESPQLACELRVQEPGGGFLFADRFGDVRADSLDERGAEAQASADSVPR